MTYGLTTGAAHVAVTTAWSGIAVLLRLLLAVRVLRIGIRRALLILTGVRAFLLAIARGGTLILFFLGGVLALCRGNFLFFSLSLLVAALRCAHVAHRAQLQPLTLT